VSTGQAIKESTQPLHLEERSYRSSCGRQVTIRRACTVCGRPGVGARCHLHAIPPRPRGRATQNQIRTLVANATRCHICGQPPTPDDPLVADHVIPRAHGGTDNLSNLKAAHRSCNGRKGANIGNNGAWTR
jgi:5-methylcytosine-specific restriction endonuclease McrA